MNTPGQSPGAVRQAPAKRQRLGGRLALDEAVTDLALAGASAHLDLLRQDLRYAWRGAVRRPGFTLAVVGVSALGVAAATSASRGRPRAAARAPLSRT